VSRSPAQWRWAVAAEGCRVVPLRDGGRTGGRDPLVDGLLVLEKVAYFGGQDERAAVVAFVEVND